jgi:hypothetical protein
MAVFNDDDIAPYAFGAPTFTYDVKGLVPKMTAGPRRKALFGQ